MPPLPGPSASQVLRGALSPDCHAEHEGLKDNEDTCGKEPGVVRQHMEERHPKKPPNPQVQVSVEPLVVALTVSLASMEYDSIKPVMGLSIENT